MEGQLGARATASRAGCVAAHLPTTATGGSCSCGGSQPTPVRNGGSAEGLQGVMTALLSSVCNVLVRAPHNAFAPIAGVLQRTGPWLRS